MSIAFYLVCPRCNVHGPLLATFGEYGVGGAPQGAFVTDHLSHVPAPGGLRFANEYEVEAENIAACDEPDAHLIEGGGIAVEP